ncbi:uncharacterized protein LOC112560815 [Pomacea canaliculata]|uniref:uncharacterized protein LOC112560815 n=1 Tax=Pomacea canaliculata TaxID=400727 RepID=UPI000D73BF8F|nr:uncharacterized protein LOC112560815 [Pomacea canaliculata]XP_025088664.1 uncharacterized protein LOC112560815 [Pomacea canaliculata]
MTGHSDRTLVRCVTAVIVATSVLSWAQLVDPEKACLCSGIHIDGCHRAYENSCLITDCTIVDASSLKNVMLQNSSAFDKFFSVLPAEKCPSGEKSSRRTNDSDPQTALPEPSGRS